jgi:hypothetical protein
MKRKTGVASAFVVAVGLRVVLAMAGVVHAQRSQARTGAMNPNPVSEPPADFNPAPQTSSPSPMA